MKRVVALALVGVVLLAGGYLGSRYYKLLYEPLPPEFFIGLEGKSAPSLAGITDPAERARAERGKYIAGLSGCDGCHHTSGRNGMVAGMYMAGGVEFRGAGITVVSKNLTADATTGLGNASDEEVLRAMRSGVARDGRIMFHRAMPWAAYSGWTEEDRRAVLTYLRHVPPITHRIPDAVQSEDVADEPAHEEYFGADYGTPAP